MDPHVSPMAMVVMQVRKIMPMMVVRVVVVVAGVVAESRIQFHGTSSGSECENRKCAPPSVLHPPSPGPSGEVSAGV